MAFVVVRLTLRQSGPQREDGSGAIQCLNLALLVHTQYQGSFRRIQIQAYDIPHLFFKAWIVGKLEPLHPMWLHVMALPDSMNKGSGNPQLSGQHPDTPVGAAVAWPGLHSGIDDLLLQFGGPHTSSTLPLANTSNGGQTIFGEGVPQCQDRGAR